MINFSIVMSYIINTYKLNCYIDTEDNSKDCFTCPKCLESIQYNEVDGYISEADNDDYYHYICPRCNKKF